MSANASPMFTRVGAVQGGVTLTTAAADYTGKGILNSLIFQADPGNGSFLQKLRFKALGTNVASVARIYLNQGTLNLASPLAAVSGTPTGTVNTGAGALAVGNYFAKVQVVDQWGGGSAMSSETAAVAVASSRYWMRRMNSVTAAFVAPSKLLRMDDSSHTTPLNAAGSNLSSCS